MWFDADFFEKIYGFLKIVDLEADFVGAAEGALGDLLEAHGDVAVAFVADTNPRAVADAAGNVGVLAGHLAEGLGYAAAERFDFFTNLVVRD